MGQYSAETDVPRCSVVLSQQTLEPTDVPVRQSALRESRRRSPGVSPPRRRSPGETASVAIVRVPRLCGHRAAPIKAAACLTVRGSPPSSSPSRIAIRRSGAEPLYPIRLLGHNSLEGG